MAGPCCQRFIGAEQGCACCSLWTRQSFGGLWVPGLHPPGVDVGVLKVRQSLPGGSRKALWTPLRGLGGFSWLTEPVLVIGASCVKVNVCLEYDFKTLEGGSASLIWLGRKEGCVPVRSCVVLEAVRTPC